MTLKNIRNKKILLAGDSLAVGLYEPLQQSFPNLELELVAQNGRSAYDEQHLQADANFVIISLGTNYATPSALAGWEEDYALRLQTIMATAPSARFVWLLPPVMGDAGLEFFVEQRRTVIRQVALKTDSIILKAWPDETRYVEIINGQRIRDWDGIHFTEYGYFLWAGAIAQSLVEDNFSGI